MTVLLAVDIGGTKTALATVAEGAGGADPYLARNRFATPGTAVEVLASLLPAARDLAGGHRVAGVGVSFGGHVQPDGQPKLRSLHVPGWEDVRLADELADALDAPVLVVNDAEAAVRGEHACISREWCDLTLAYVTISTGIGGALLLGGRPHRGRHGLAGEIGHLRLGDSGVCSCGGVGHLEAYASGPAIARTARTRLVQHPTWPTSLRGRHVLTARDVADAARGGDEFAAQVLAEAGALVGRAVAVLALLLDPDVVLIGGGVAQSGEAFWEPLRAAVRADVLRHTLVRPAMLGADSALRGAVEVAADAAEVNRQCTDHRQAWPGSAAHRAGPG